MLEQALRFLKFRSRTVAELRSKLLERGYETEEVESVLVKLQEVKLLDDDRFVEHFIHDHLEIRRQGRWRIGLEMRRRQVPKEKIDQSVREITNEDELVVASQLLESRQRSWQKLEPLARKRRAIGLLQRRGFAISVISQLIKKLS